MYYNCGNAQMSLIEKAKQFSVLKLVLKLIKRFRQYNCANSLRDLKEIVML